MIITISFVHCVESPSVGSVEVQFLTVVISYVLTNCPSE